MVSSKALIENLKSYIGDRTKNLVYDSNTFLKVRFEKPFEIGGEIGGGNLLIALGLFAVLSYLAKVYKALRGGRPTTEEEAKNARKILNNNPQLKQYLIPKIQGQFNETDAFYELIKDAHKEAQINFGLQPKKYREIYSAIRHKLTHIIAPQEGHLLLTYIPAKGQIVPFSKIKSDIRNSGDPAFTLEGDTWQCNVDLLNRDVEKISEWLVKKIDGGKFTEEDMKYTLGWIRDQLSKKG